MANKFVKRIVEIIDYQTHILEELRKGVVLTTSDAGRINSMAISWGMLGVEWNKPIFITFVRTGRFTHELLMKNPQFTVNIPQGKRPQDIISYLGRHSGRTEDKIKALGLHTVESPNSYIPVFRLRSLLLRATGVGRDSAGPSRPARPPS